MSELVDSPWQWWRSQMPVCQHWAYFDHAAVGPLSQPARRAMEQYVCEAAEQGDTVWPTWADKVQKLRAGFAHLLNAREEEICTVPNTTTGINLVAEGWPWQSGDNVVIPEGEFPSNLFPWLNQETRGVEVRVVPRRGDRVVVDDLLSQIDSRTQVVATSWVGYASGYRIDLDALVQGAHERGAMVFLDAIQGLGVFPLDLAETPVDFLSADGHKWLLGPEGMGIAMIREEHWDKLRCGNIGWASVKNSFSYAEPDMTLKRSAARFESGSSNMGGSAALLASLEIFLSVRAQHGEDAIANRILALVQSANQKIIDLGAKTRVAADPVHRSGILTFQLPDCQPAEFRERALAENVVVSCRDGGIRASIHAYNDEHDIQRLVNVVKQSMLATA